MPMPEEAKKEITDKPKKKNKQSKASIRACRENIKKANEARRLEKTKKALVAMDARIANLDNDLEEEVERQIKLRFKDVDRKTLKNEILAVFYDMGGRKWLKKIAKSDPKLYLTIMNNLLKAENDKEGGGGIRSVTVNVYGGRSGRREVDVTPLEPN